MKNRMGSSEPSTALANARRLADGLAMKHPSLLMMGRATPQRSSPPPAAREPANEGSPHPVEGSPIVGIDGGVIGHTLPGGAIVFAPDQDAATRMAAFEAGRAGPSGMLDVFAVMDNRSRLSGKSLREIVYSNQFEPWYNAKTRAESLALDPLGERYQAAAHAILPLMTGQIEDPTGGATHFVAKKVMLARGQALPAWATGPGETRGPHTFFKLPFAGKAPESLVRRRATAWDRSLWDDSLRLAPSPEDQAGRLRAAAAPIIAASPLDAFRKSSPLPLPPRR